MLKRLLLGAALLALLGATAGAAAWQFGTLRPEPLQAALLEMETGQYRAAWVELRTAVRDRPNDPAIRLALARTLARLADPVAAEREFRVAAGAGADKWQLLPELGEAMIAQGKFKEILAQIPPTAPLPAVAARNLALRATAQLALGDRPAAQLTLKAIRRIAPDAIEVALIQARLAAAAGDLAATEQNVADILRRDPDQVEALLMQEQLLTARKDYPAALAVANKAVAAAPWSAMARIDRAYQLMFNNHDTQAQADVDAVLANQPRFIDGIYLNGILKARRGDYQAAERELARLQNAGSRFPQALLYLAKVSRTLGHLEAAAEHARRYNILMPTDPDGVKMVARTRLDIANPAPALPIVEAAIGQGPADAELLDLAGRLYVATGNDANALASFQKAAEAAPEDATILANLGMAQMRRGSQAAATATLEAAVKLDPNLVEAQENLALAYLQQNRLPQARAILATLAQSRGDTATLGLLRSELELRQGDTPAAHATLAATLKRFPQSTAVKKALATVLGSEGATGQAIRLLLEVLARQPADIQAIKPLLTVFAQSNQVPAAIPVLEAAVKAAPDTPALLAMLADTYTATGAPQRAIDSIAQARQASTSQSSPTPVVLLAPLARAQAATGAFDQASQNYAATLEARPRDQAVRLEQVTFLNARNDTAQAEASLRDAIAAAPGELLPMTNLATFIYMTRGLDPAVAAIEALKANPLNLPMATALEGDLLMRFDRAPQAAAAYRRGLQAAPSEPLLIRYAAAAAMSGHDDVAAEALRSWLQANPASLQPAAMLARLEISAKRWAQATALIQPLLAASPNDPVALTLQARIHLGTNDPRALDVARQAYLLSPSAQTADALGWVMTATGDVKSAIPILNRATKDLPADPAIRYHLAVALHKAGQTAKAVPLLHALKTDPVSFDERNDAVQLLQGLNNTP